MKLLHFVYLGLFTVFMKYACIRATINRVIPNMYYQVDGCEDTDLLVECPVGYYIEVKCETKPGDIPQMDVVKGEGDCPNIADGTYGRSSGTQCLEDGEDPVPDDKLPCAGTSVFDIGTVTACNGRETCNLKVNAEEMKQGLGDCPSNRYLNISFNCLKPINEIHVCDGETLVVSCPGEEVVQIVDVLYGRNDAETCAADGRTQNTQCYAAEAGWKIPELCNHKPYCEIQASAMFEDPCPDTSKFMRVVYQCAACQNEDGDDEKCDAYALRGECEINPTWMMASCRKSCWRCDTNMACRDISDFYDCTKWASTGECYNNEAWMRENCQYSCNKCFESVAHQQQVNKGTEQQQEYQPEVNEEEVVQDKKQKEEEKVEVHKRDTRNHSDRSEDSDGPPFKKYYSVIVLVGTVVVMSIMIIWLSFRPKEEPSFKKSA